MLATLNSQFAIITSAISVDCQVTDWGPWGDCSVGCGNGTESRNRSVTVQPEMMGKECPPLQLSRACNEDPCPGENDNAQNMHLHKLRKSCIQQRFDNIILSLHSQLYVEVDGMERLHKNLWKRHQDEMAGSFSRGTVWRETLPFEED